MPLEELSDVYTLSLSVYWLSLSFDFLQVLTDFLFLSKVRSISGNQLLDFKDYSNFFLIQEIVFGAGVKLLLSSSVKIHVRWPIRLQRNKSSLAVDCYLGDTERFDHHGELARARQKP